MTDSNNDIVDGFDLYFLQLRARAFENSEIISEDGSGFVSTIKDFFDVQQRYFRVHYQLILSSHVHSIYSTVITNVAYLKNMYSLFSGIELTLNGYYGSARIIFRHVFEFLIIAKYSSVTQNEKFITHWKNEGNIGIGKQVLKKIKNEEVGHLKSFWEQLCMFNHATSSSQQIGVRFDSVKDDIPENLAIIAILLLCNEHLLTQHSTHRSMKYYANLYFGDKVFEIRKDFKIIKHRSKHFLTPVGLKILRAYCSKWDISK